MSTKFYTTLTVATAAALAIAGTSASAHDRGGTRERCVAVTEAQVNAQFQRFNDGFQTRNPDVMVPLFSRNAVLLPTVSGQMRTDAAGIRDYFVSFLPNAPFGTITESETTIGCNMATRVGNWTVRLTNPTTGATSDVAARFSFVYTYEDGDWKILHLHSSARPN
jgi:uncharacterized protein (TIGR02246 family)